MAIEWMIPTGYEEEMSTKLPQALREQRYQCAPVRVVERPKPQGGTSPLGIAPGEERVVQTAMRLVVAPLFAADLHDCADGDRPKRDAKQASLAIRADRYNRALTFRLARLTSHFSSVT